MNGILVGTNSDRGAELLSDIWQSCGHIVPLARTSRFRFPIDFSVVRHSNGAGLKVPRGDCNGGKQPADLRLYWTNFHQFLACAVCGMGWAGGCGRGCSVYDFASDVPIFRPTESRRYIGLGPVQQHHFSRQGSGLPADGHSDLSARLGRENILERSNLEEI